MNTQEKKIGNELDLTSMVDVTFLLLIFFIVTASFSSQKSLAEYREQPGVLVKESRSGTSIQVVIDQFNTYCLTDGTVEEMEAPTDQEMRVRLRNLIRDTHATQLKISAHGDAWHEKVVAVWVAGIDNQIEDIAINISNEGYRPFP